VSARTVGRRPAPQGDEMRDGASGGVVALAALSPDQRRIVLALLAAADAAAAESLEHGTRGANTGSRSRRGRT
jgi:hypothetical protein